MINNNCAQLDLPRYDSISKLTQQKSQIIQPLDMKLDRFVINCRPNNMKVYVREDLIIICKLLYVIYMLIYYCALLMRKLLVFEFHSTVICSNLNV